MNEIITLLVSVENYVDYAVYNEPELNITWLTEFMLLYLTTGKIYL